MRNPLIIAACWAALFAAPVQAQNPVVVELYTSQGCSSCPPADALLQELSEQRDVIALALHVDYWDYLGWKDEFAHPAFSHRQSLYAHTWRQRTVYTPQMVIHGGEYMAGNQRASVMREIAQAQARPAGAEIEATRQGTRAVITIRPLAGAAPSKIYMVRYIPRATVSIERGENAGREIEYINIVRDWMVAADWDGLQTISLTPSDLGTDPWVVIVQQDGTGPILAAMVLN